MLAHSFFSNPLLHNAATQVCVDQTLRHFRYRFAQSRIGQLCFAHPATEMTGFEYALHGMIMPLSGIDKNLSKRKAS
jgi:hypothetical protein